MHLLIRCLDIMLELGGRTHREVILATQSNGSSATAQRGPLFPRISVTSADRNRIILVIIAALVLYWLIAQSIDALGPFLFALALAYLMSPLVDFFDRAMPRALAILLVYAVFIAVAAGLVWWLAPRVANQIKELVDSAPVYQTRVQAWIAGLTDWYQALPLSDDVRTSLENAVKNATGNILGVVQRTTIGILLFVSRTMGFVVGLLIIPFWLFYVLKRLGPGDVRL